MGKLKNLKHIFVIIILSLICVGSMILLFSRDFTNAINGFFIYRTGSGAWQDHIYKHTLRPSDNIAIIKIDEKTLNELQANGDLKMLTISKKIYADLVEKLEGAGVAGIAFDIIFQNSDPDQQEFAKTLKKYDNIVIGSSISSVGEDPSTACSTDKESGMVTCKGFPQTTYAGVPWGLVDVGSVNTDEHITDHDGAFSRITRFNIFGQGTLQGRETIPGSWKHNLGFPTELYSLSVELARLKNSKVIMREEFRSATILNPYFGRPDSYASMSMIDILHMPDEVLRQAFQGKYILIGESGTFIHDSIVSPVSRTLMDGVELHAHFLDGILQDKILIKTTDLWVPFAVFILTILTTIVYFYIPKYLSPIVAIVMCIAILWTVRYLYDIHRVLTDIFPLFLSVLITLPTTFSYRFLVVDREKRYIENAFGHYIDPTMVKMIDAEEVSLSLGGEQRELSVFFSDIAGFTTISEQLSPKDLFWLMSFYLSRMTEVLKREGGTLDKYIGDAVMGFFGAPIGQTDHAIRACRTAIAMRAILPEINRDIVKRGIPEINFRVGIASGDILVGNIGSTEHFNYTVLGDTVNLASRLEATGKEYDTHIIISQGTKNQIGELFDLRELDTIAVKGKNEGVRIYELLDFRGKILDNTIYTRYEEALGLYRSRSYLEAGKLWESQMESDGPSRVMALRCVDILRGNLRVENGIYHMTHK